MTAYAKLAKGCISQEARNSPLASRFMALPNPHPGHQVKPKLSKGQRLKASEYGLMVKMARIHAIQVINSTGIVCSRCLNSFMFFNLLK
jgi:hypothetical protein